MNNNLTYKAGVSAFLRGAFKCPTFVNQECCNLWCDGWANEWRRTVEAAEDAQEFAAVELLFSFWHNFFQANLDHCRLNPAFRWSVP